MAKIRTVYVAKDEDNNTVDFGGPAHYEDIRSVEYMISLFNLENYMVLALDYDYENEEYI